MKIETITSFISIITALQLILFSVFVLTTKNRVRKSLQILTIFLLSNAVYILAFLLRKFANDIGINPIPLFTILFSSGFLFGPSLYWYSITMTKKVRPKLKIFLIHFVLFFLLLLFIPVHGLITNVWGIPASLFRIIMSVMNIQILCYLAATLYEISSYQHSLKNSYSSLEKMNLSWLKFNVIAFICMWLVDIANFITARIGINTYDASVLMTFASLLINFLFANMIIYKGLTSPELFIEPIELPKKNRYLGSLLSSEQSSSIAEKLKNYMENEKPFLEPDITLQEISSKIGIQSRYVSQVINERFNKNFFEFVNDYRVEEAKTQLAAENGDAKTVLEILYECGFNSKSVFNTFFKKSTGLTPSQYRKRCSIAS